MPQRQFPVGWYSLCVSFTVLHKVLELSRFNRMCGKIFIPSKLSEWMVTIFFWLKKIYAPLKKIFLFYIMLQKILELFCNNFRSTKFMGTQKAVPIASLLSFLSQRRVSIRLHFFPVFANITEDTGIIVLQSNVWKIYADIMAHSITLNNGIFWTLCNSLCPRAWVWFSLAHIPTS